MAQRKEPVLNAFQMAALPTTPPTPRGVANAAQKVYDTGRRATRKALNSQGRAVVDLAPCTKNAIRITGSADSAEHKVKLAKLIGKSNGARSQ